MTSTMASRWANDEADKAEEQRRKREKEEKKRLKLQKQQEAEAAAATQQQATNSRPTKRRRLSAGSADSNEAPTPKVNQEDRPLLRFNAGTWTPCHHTSNYETLNHIEEGSYGYVSRARSLTTSTIVALKKIKMDPSSSSLDGFPLTALREIHILQRCHHPNIVSLQEILAGDDPTECVLVMEFLEHDLKTLQEDMQEPFLASEVKTLVRQLASGLEYLHDNAIMHRDLKTSNILLNNRGLVKIADFGMARYIPPPSSSTTSAPAQLTQLVVTLWYRAPELLLGTPTYTPSIDLWSLGCIFAELLLKTPLFPGKNEIDTLSQIFSLCGLPSEATYPSFYRLPNAKSLKIPRSTTIKTPGFNRAKFPFLTTSGVDLLSTLLSLNPEKRPVAKEVLEHGYFREQPKAKPAEMFPTFPSKAGQERRRRKSPAAPKRGEGGGLLQGGGGLDFSSIFKGREDEDKGAGFQLKMARPGIGRVAVGLCAPEEGFAKSDVEAGRWRLESWHRDLGERDRTADGEREGDGGVRERRGVPDCAERGRLGDRVCDRRREGLRERDGERRGDGDLDAIAWISCDIYSSDQCVM
ncbi:cmgc cdk kinase [Pyrenophora seminiperda CCB06]|uniref:cyclin-dependent kinase n=1 Tax=Pyrenophora seminiperda CCB06 TaxID=1302712 RepID=A0A3M7MDD4_9PLEO|nr:cmgc cdk kinase [Pyrenophora seminiperda CCB06]